MKTLDRNFLSSRKRALLFLVLLVQGFSHLGQAQEETKAAAATSVQPADPAKDTGVSHTNSLGMSFVSPRGLEFQIGIYEVTVGEFAKFSADSGYRRDAKPLYFAQDSNHPVVNINLEDARAFCVWLTRKERKEKLLSNEQSYRLPTDREWDAAVGLTASSGQASQIYGDERDFPWGDEWPPPAGAGNYAADEIEGYEDPFSYTSPRGSFRANKHGIFDLGGNVWEWTSDPSTSDQVEGTLRGGGWIYFSPEFMRSSYHYKVPKNMRAPTFGFRCVYDDKEFKGKVLLARDRKKKADVAAASKRLQVETDSNLEKDAIKEARSRFLRSESSQNKPEITKAENSQTDDSDRKEMSAIEKARSRLLLSRSRGRPGEMQGDKQVASPVKGARFVNSLGMEFVPLPGGRILAGAVEVRVKEFDYFVSKKKIPWKRPTFNQGASHCAVGVTYDQAVEFCEWLTELEQAAGILRPDQRYRLPTDAEWSLSALLEEGEGMPSELSGQSPGIFPWGVEWPPPSSSGNIDGDKISGFRDRFSYTAPAGVSAKNRLGIADLVGNALEWCSDEFSSGSGTMVVRGSSWLDSSQESIHSSHRRHFPRDTSKINIGFRCFLQLD